MPPSRRADLLQLEQIAAGYPSRERFLTELTLDPPDATSDQAGVPLLDEDYLILSTIHSAKGQEWKSVFVLNVVDGCIPSDLGDRHDGGDRGGAAAALRRHDAGQGQSAPRRAASLLHAWTECAMAIGTSMPPAPASFRRHSCPGSKARLGHRPKLPAADPRDRGFRSMSARGCGRCGVK